MRRAFLFREMKIQLLPYTARDPYPPLLTREIHLPAASRLPAPSIQLKCKGSTMFELDKENWEFLLRIIFANWIVREIEGCCTRRPRILVSSCTNVIRPLNCSDSIFPPQTHEWRVRRGGGAGYFNFKNITESCDWSKSRRMADRLCFH